MSKMERFRTFIRGIFTVIFAIVMFFVSEDGIRLIAMILGITVVLYGVRMLHYYSSMARHMVGGKITLYLGIVSLCFGLFTFSILDSSRLFLVIYLIAMYIFTGAVELMNGLEKKKYNAPGWRRKIIYGAVCVLVGILAIILGVFTRSLSALVYMYAAGLFTSGVIRVGQAYKKTEIVYIS